MDDKTPTLAQSNHQPEPPASKRRHDVNRIFLVLASLALAFLVVTLVVGLSLGDVPAALTRLARAETRLATLDMRRDLAPDAAAEREQLAVEVAALRKVEQWKTVHFLLGIASAVGVMLVAGIVVTYFIGTGRWCREVVETYQLDPALVEEATRAKRRAFPFAMLVMFTVLVIVALGGASDPSAAFRPAPVGGLAWSEWHLFGSLGGTVLIAGAFAGLWLPIVANQATIEKIVAEVKRVRRERGLPE